MMPKPEKAAAICKRATELRVFADSIQDPENHAAVLQWAEMYEEFANYIIDTASQEQPITRH